MSAEHTAGAQGAEGRPQALDAPLSPDRSWNAGVPGTRMPAMVQAAKTGDGGGGWRRFSGLLVVFALAVIGIGFGSQWWKSGELRESKRRIQAAIDAAPTTTEGRLAAWTQLASPQVHSCLLQMRLSSESPWLVTHAVRHDGASEVEFYGIDLTDMPTVLVARDGLVARVRLPEPGPVGRAPLSGDMARYVPVYAPGMRVSDPVERLRGLTLRALGGLPQGLVDDIPEASFELLVGPGTTWDEVRPAAAPAREPDSR